MPAPTDNTLIDDLDAKTVPIAADEVPLWDTEEADPDNPTKKVTLANLGKGIDHGVLVGLSDDDHTRYANLAGRSGGQTLQGGTGASEALTLESTANGTKGKVTSKDNHEFQKSAVFDAEPANVIAIGAVTIDWTLGNKQKLTNDADATVTFTPPSGPCNLILKIVHAANATTYTPTWPNTCKTPGGTAPTLTQTSGAIDIIGIYYDGANYFMVGNAAFAAIV
jgi:hypothetical protein